MILHSDGDIRAILPDLVEIGLTTLNPVQPEVLDHAWLQQRVWGEAEFLRRSFDAGSAAGRHRGGGARRDHWRARARWRRKGRGWCWGASHRMQSDIPARNVEAMLDAFDEAKLTGR